MKRSTLFLLIAVFYFCFASAQSTLTPSTKINWYPDFDADGSGSTTGMITKKRQPIGYVATTGDCNDANINVHPGALEIYNGIDDNCSGTIDEGFTTDMVITTSKSLANPQLASVPTVDIFFTGGYKPRNITEPNYAALVKGLGSRFFSSSTGVYAQYIRIYPQRTMLDGPGNGYNIPAQYANKMDSVGKQKFFIDDRPYDFAAAGDSLRKIVGAGGIIEANIATAPIEDTYVQIDRLIASGQKKILIQPGQELVNDKSFFSTGTLYAAAADNYFASILKRYPGTSFEFGIDCAAKWKKDSEKNKLWNNQVSVSKYATVHDDYFHMMFLVKDGLNGVMDHDTAEVGYALHTALPAQIDHWRTDPLLKRYKLNVTQLSGAIAGYINPTEVVKHKFYVAMFTWSAINYFNTWNAIHGDSIVGCTVMTLKDMIDAKNNVTLDYQLLSTGYQLFQPGAYTCLVKENYNQVEIGITAANGSYYVVMLNSSGKELPLPRYIIADGKYSQFNPVTRSGYYCDAVNSDKGIAYSPDVLKKYSINFFEIKP